MNRKVALNQKRINSKKPVFGFFWLKTKILALSTKRLGLAENFIFLYSYIIQDNYFTHHPTLLKTEPLPAEKTPLEDPDRF